MFQALHGADEHGNARAVDVRDTGKIDDKSFRLLIDDLAQRSTQLRGNVEIDGALGGEHVWRFGFGHLGDEHATRFVTVSRHRGTSRNEDKENANREHRLASSLEI